VFHPHRPHHPYHHHHPHGHPTESHGPHVHDPLISDSDKLTSFIRARSKTEIVGALLAVVILAWLIFGFVGVAVVLMTGTPLVAGVLSGSGYRW
jgi:hypothetical protein